eukprot:1864092-Prymnesium_polylepis.1
MRGNPSGLATRSSTIHVSSYKSWAEGAIVVRTAANMRQESPCASARSARASCPNYKSGGANVKER